MWAVRTIMRLCAKLEKKFGRTANELPIVFVGDQMLAGEMEIMEKLNPLLLEVQAKGGSLPSSY